MNHLARGLALLSLLGLTPFIVQLALTVLSHVSDAGPSEGDLGGPWLAASALGIYAALLFGTLAGIASRFEPSARGSWPARPRSGPLVLLAIGLIVDGAITWLSPEVYRLLLIPSVIVGAAAFYVLWRDSRRQARPPA